jgi:hypothetical protein
LQGVGDYYTNISEEHNASIFRVEQHWRQYVPPEYWYLPPSPQDVIYVSEDILKGNKLFSNSLTSLSF